MRHLITGLVAAVAVMAAAPAMACGYTPCAQPQVYVAPVASYGCNPCGGGGGGWAHERLAAPEQQYYYVNQGPTYTGPGNWAPQPTYEEGSVSGYGYARPANYGYRPHYGYRQQQQYSYRQNNYGYRYHRPWAPRVSYYHAPRMSYHHGYAPRRGYAQRYAPAPYHYGHRVLRRYY